MTYVDVILPLPLEGMFTYSVPPALEQGAQVGRRALVPFGKSKTCIGIIAKRHADKPVFAVKDIKALPDDHPAVTEVQLELWRWIAEYYMAPIGDVLNAALPAGLKDDGAYRPKTETCVRLAPEYAGGRGTEILRAMLQRAPASLKVIDSYLSLAAGGATGGGRGGEGTAVVTRDELINEAQCTVPTFRYLVMRKIFCTYEREVGRLNHDGDRPTTEAKPLGREQQEALGRITAAFGEKDVVLLHGVTSSGKTEIYIHLIQQALASKRQVLYLLPEIALTVQICQRLRAVFGGSLGIYHSKYSDAERVEIWRKQLSAEPYGVVLGARSAVYLPFTNLGLVIIDEEHESSFKQQDPSPRYHARSTAIMLARMSGAKVLLGSATPSAESLHNAGRGKYGYVRLDKRYNNMPLPTIQVVDTKDLLRRKMMRGPFSPPLLVAMRHALKGGRQVILFQNRRGFAPMVECRECGWVPRCDKCDVSLTYHKSLGRLTCHYCGATYAVPAECPCCGSRDLRGRGYGTEKIEDRVREAFPEARVARMDLDTTRSRKAYGRIINDFSEHKTDILIGTQMVSKGLDFDNVAVVGILDADSMLNYPDFRAYEHAYMMISQVAGRAGRKDGRGLVLLQTKSPQLPVVAQIVAGEARAFYAALMEERRLFHYPPFSHLVYAYVKHRDEAVAASAAEALAGELRRWFGDRVLGPDKPAIGRINSVSIRKIVVKLENGIDLSKARLYLQKARNTVAASPRHKTAQVYFDVDPE